MFLFIYSLFSAEGRDDESAECRAGVRIACRMAGYLFEIFVVACLPLCSQCIIFEDYTCFTDTGAKVFSRIGLRFGSRSVVWFGHTIGVRLSVSCPKTDIFITVKCA